LAVIFIVVRSSPDCVVVVQCAFSETLLAGSLVQAFLLNASISQLLWASCKPDPLKSPS